MSKSSMSKSPDTSRRVSIPSGGEWRSLCIRRGYSKPAQAESREGTSTVTESFRVTYCSILITWRLGWRNDRRWLADDSGDVILDSDWLTKFNGILVLDSEWLTKFRAFVLISADNFLVLDTSRVCSAIYIAMGSGLIFGTVRLFRKKNF